MEGVVEGVVEGKMINLTIMTLQKGTPFLDGWFGEGVQKSNTVLINVKLPEEMTDAA